MIGPVLRLFGLGDARYLVLLGVGALASVAAVWGMWGQAQRETLAVWAAKTCAAAGAPFDPKVLRAEPPVGCRARVAALAEGERQFLKDQAEEAKGESAALAQTLERRLERERRDGLAAARLATEAARAHARLKQQEIKEAERASNDPAAELSDDYWSALWSSAGVRQPAP